MNSEKFMPHLTSQLTVNTLISLEHLFKVTRIVLNSFAKYLRGGRIFNYWIDPSDNVVKCSNLCSNLDEFVG